MTSFAELLRHHRQSAGISQEELAHRASLSPKAVSLLERGQRRFPRRETIEELTKALGLSGPNATALAESARRRPGTATPSQLPPAPATFTGRREVLDTISGYLSPGGVPHPGVAIVTIDGMAGVGKTALAVQAAHEVVDDYPDGQLFIDLHGFTESVEPEDAGAILARVLRTLGVPGQRIPDELEQRSALYRTRLAGRRMLIVLDNAVSAEQVSPLLPGTAGCAVLITSRSRLTGLGSARPFSIDPLSTDEAVALFTELAGAAGDPGLLRRVVELCDCLPLAVQIVAARYDDGDLAGLAGRLGSPAESLADLRAGQESVAAAFALSYRQFPAGHQRLFRLMSLAPGAAMDEAVVAAGTDLTVREVRPILDDLVDGHLLIENEPAVYTFHDLVRAYSALLSVDEDGTAGRSAAVERFKTHYAGTATTAMDLLYPSEEQRRPRGLTGDLSTARSAERWLDRETDTLLRLAQDDAQLNPYLCGTIHRHLQSRARVTEAVPLYRAALAAAQNDGDAVGVARLGAMVALGLQIRGLLDPAIEAYTEALAAARRADWQVGEIVAAMGLGEIARMSGRNAEAKAQYDRVLELSLATGYRSGECQALLGLGDLQCTSARFAEATITYARSLAVAEEIGEHQVAINAGVGLGDVHFDLGRLEQAAEQYREALAAAEKLQTRTVVNYARASLAGAYWKLGRYEEAADLQRQCLQYTREVGEAIAEIGALLSLAEIQLSSGRYDEALQLFEQSDRAARDQGEGTFRLQATQGLGKLAHLRADYSQAVELFRTAIGLADELDQGIDRGTTRQRLAAALAALDRTGESLPYLQEAVKIFTDLQVPELAEAQQQLAELQA
ncbi:tetratricopeptide repeat protein [Kribbella qitaiheensis]|uniref:Tetratricopeptide repeat protein n=1 Tax=Kribbella qitaiheensis TaxID=1544730 RepID=A0A7G6X4F6_9ACTN|nr:helix-turn-helix domain-containing protein [Kribbella qitaiheensis]QNE21121.1 tetratricopeptide repeat protein [Kribbella qitaiheensis]